MPVLDSLYIHIKKINFYLISYFNFSVLQQNLVLIDTMNDKLYKGHDLLIQIMILVLVSGN